MGLMTELGYEVAPAGGAHRVVQRVVASVPGAWVMSRVLHPIDRHVFRRTDGRATVTSALGGVPVVMLTTTGAKSGRPRTMPLLGIPIGEHLAVIGSNFGQEATPGWVYNLEADPRAEVEYRGRSVDVVARRGSEAETAEVFRVAEPIYGGYEKYVERASHRTIRVFVLEPVSPSGKGNG